MNRLEVRPYLTGGPGRVEASPWIMVDTGDPIPAGPVVGWDPTVGLRLGRRLTVDLTGMRMDCGLHQRTQLLAAGVWSSPSTTVRGGSASSALEGEGTARVDLHLDVPGRVIAGEVVLRTQVVVGEPAAPGSPLAATVPGSILWEDEVQIALEGSGSRFPVEIVDFAGAGWLPAGSGWYLDWSPDEPDAPALAAIRLYLNSANDPVREAVSAVMPDARQAAIREAIAYDVARTLIVRSLQSHAFDAENVTFEDDSVGGVVRRLISALLPGDTLSGLRAKCRADVQRIECDLQASLRLFKAGRIP